MRNRLELNIQSIRIKILYYLEHPIFEIFMAFVTLYVIYSADIKNLVLDPSTDTTYYNIAYSIFFLYSLEIILLSFVK